MKTKKIVALALLTCLGISSCSDDETTSTYSKREYVYCYFQAIQYAELINVMGNLGQYASIRKRVVDGVTNRMGWPTKDSPGLIESPPA